MTSKIGFACMILDRDGEVLDGTRMRTTTVKHFSTLTSKSKRDRIGELAFSNLQSLHNQVNWLCKQPEQLRFMRITSDLFPLYTHEIAGGLYKDLRKSIEFTLARIGQKTRDNSIRLTSHPGQFTVLNNPDPAITHNSVQDLEYHYEIFQMMGLDFKNHNSVINIHGGARANGLDQFLINSRLLSDGCRSMISVENDENSFGVDDILNSVLPEYFKVVVDVHHHWIFSGDYMHSDDLRWQQVAASWKGNTPKVHISMSPEDLVAGLALDQNGLHVAPQDKRNVLRKHSDLIWSAAFRRYAANFLQHGDIIIEAKNKNLAASQIYNELINEKRA